MNAPMTSPIAIAERLRLAYGAAVRRREIAGAKVTEAADLLRDARDAETQARRAMLRAEHLASLHVEPQPGCEDCRARTQREATR